MRRGPNVDSKMSGLSFEAKARVAYATVPDEVIELARLADREGLSVAAQRINYSKAVISTVINGKYAGDLDRVVAMVRGSLMAETVDCPVLGEIGRDRCLTEQNEPFRATSAFRARLFHACRSGCPHARRKETRTDE